MDNLTFWRVVKPLLSGKVKPCRKISLVEDNEVFTNDEKNEETFKSFFSEAVKNLEILKL